MGLAVDQERASVAAALEIADAGPHDLGGAQGLKAEQALQGAIAQVFELVIVGRGAKEQRRSTSDRKPKSSGARRSRGARRPVAGLSLRKPARPRRRKRAAGR